MFWVVFHVVVQGKLVWPCLWLLFVVVVASRLGSNITAVVLVRHNQRNPTGQAATGWLSTPSLVLFMALYDVYGFM